MAIRRHGLRTSVAYTVYDPESATGLRLKMSQLPWFSWLLLWMNTIVSWPMLRWMDLAEWWSRTYIVTLERKDDETVVARIADLEVDLKLKKAKPLSGICIDGRYFTNKADDILPSITETPDDF